ncbi:MAG: GT-D fold domain-containing protein [Lachnospiraceae bacterium]|nr:GT-D fold domain-containing protein [Lachnospiraceae bacterium]
MKRIYIFGVGKGKASVRRCLREENVRILGYVDNAADLYPDGVDNLPVVAVKDMQEDYDNIVISVMGYEQITLQLLASGVNEKKIIRFYQLEDAMNFSYWTVLDADKWRIEALLQDYMQSAHYYIENMKYEVADAVQKEEIRLPKMQPPEIAVDRICREKASLVRFGDGEFELLNRRPRPLFQKVDDRLAMKLEKVLKSNDARVLIAIANNYGSLNSYTESAAFEIRKYMTKRVRQEHMVLLDMDREYFDAYLSRPYLMYRDKENAGIRFNCVKRIWDKRDIIIIEGEMTRTGVGNDLLNQAASVQRILVPTEQAFDHYDEILKEAKKLDRQKLFLIVLGPTATVLAYDLAVCGYQAVDIGQIDLEYEWYLRGVKERCSIPYKYVHRINDTGMVREDKMPESVEQAYLEQVIGTIC